MSYILFRLECQVTLSEVLADISALSASLISGVLAKFTDETIGLFTQKKMSVLSMRRVFGTALVLSRNKD